MFKPAEGPSPNINGYNVNWLNFSEAEKSGPW